MDFKSLEDIKDGRINSAKYHGGRVRSEGVDEDGDLHHPHVIIMSNETINYLKEGKAQCTLSRLRIAYLDGPRDDLRWFKVSDTGAEEEAELDAEGIPL